MIRILFFILISYFIFRFVMKLLLPFLLRVFIKKGMQNFEKHFNQKPKQPEGTITINKDSAKVGRKTGGDKDDYVNFEEVKD